MKFLYILIFTTILIQFSITHLAFSGALAAAEKNPKKVTAKSKLETRIDFGNSYIIGQTIKSGAVYLLQRKKSEIKSMLKYRKDFRKEILEDFHVEDLKVKDDKAH